VQYIEEHERISGFVLSLMLSGYPAAKPMVERGVAQVERSIRQGQEQGIYRPPDPASSNRGCLAGLLRVSPATALALDRNCSTEVQPDA